jgi:anaerobic selenocysteine-containing dehydrogenase
VSQKLSRKKDGLKAAAGSATAKKSDERMVRTICSLCGPMPGCGLNCYVRDGRLVRVEGMKEAPANKGTLCPKAFASVQWLYSPQRL